MKKSTLMSVVFAAVASLPFSLPQNIQQPSVVYAQEKEDRLFELFEQARQFSLNYRDERFYFSNNGLNEQDKKILQTLDDLVAENPDDLEARYLRGNIYYFHLNDWRRAKEDYDYLLANNERIGGVIYGVHGMQSGIEREGNGHIRGKLVSDDESVTNGAVLLFSGYYWKVGVVRDGNFDFLYNHGEVSKESSVPLIFLAEGKKPVFKTLELTENNNEVDLGEITLNETAEEGIHVGGFMEIKQAGCVYYGPGVTPPVWVDFAKNETVSLGEGIIITSDQDGFFYKKLDVLIKNVEFLNERIVGEASNSSNGTAIFSKDILKND